MDLVCKRCGYSSSTVGNLKTHYKRKNECRDVLCCGLSASILLKNISTDKSLYKHVCEGCGIRFKSRQGKYIHRTKCISLVKEKEPANQELQSVEILKIPEFGQEVLEDNDDLYNKCISEIYNSIYYVAKAMYYKDPKRASIYVKNVRLNQAEIFLEAHWQIVIFTYIIPKIITKCNIIVSSYYQRFLQEKVYSIKDSAEQNNARESTLYRQNYINDMTRVSSLNYKKTYTMIKGLIMTYKKPRELEF